MTVFMEDTTLLIVSIQKKMFEKNFNIKLPLLAMIESGQK